MLMDATKLRCRISITAVQINSEQICLASAQTGGDAKDGRGSSAEPLSVICIDSDCL